MDTEHLAAALWKRLADNYSETAVQWPGVDFDTLAVDEWVRPTLLGVTPPRQRSGQGLFRLRFEVAIFVKRGTDLYRAEEVADAVRAVYDQQRFRVQDYQAADDPVVGTIHLHEGQLRDLGDDAARAEVRHLVLDYEGLADSQ